MTTTGVFGEILGQSRVVETLTSAIGSGRVHHAWIFHGPAGVGKFTTARAFAGALLTPGVRVEEGVAAAPVASAASAADEAHPDLHIITKELARHSEDASVRARKLMSIPKEVLVERLLKPAALAPTVSAASLAKKVFVVDEAELLAPVAQNALLKTLEEPPAGTVVILVTSSGERLLATIRSRCQRVGFGPIDEASLRAWATRTGIEASAGEMEWLIGYARGAPGLLLAAHEAGLASWAARLEPMLAGAEAGRYDADLGPIFAEFVEEWASGVVERRKADNPSKDAANKAGAARLMDMLAERARGRLRPGRGEAEVERALHDLDTIARAQGHIRANVNLRLALENLAAQLTG